MKSIICAVVLALPGISAATLYDLQTDWSDVLNPNGAWTLEKDLGNPFHVVQSDFFSDGSMQKAWADDPYPVIAHVPVWMKATAPTTYDYLPGDIVMHGSVNWRTGSMNTSAVWTSDINGIATMAGSTWIVRNIGRQMDWGLFKNGTLLTSGHIFGGDGHTRANPFDFSTGSGGAGVLTQNVAVGDRLELRYISLDDLPDMAGLRFQVNAVVPEPASLLTLTLGLAALARRKKS